VFSGDVFTQSRISSVIHVALSFEFLPGMKVSFNIGFGTRDSGLRIQDLDLEKARCRIPDA
jgi:hypothetical protein